MNASILVIHINQYICALTGCNLEQDPVDMNTSDTEASDTEALIYSDKEAVRDELKIVLTDFCKCSSSVESKALPDYHEVERQGSLKSVYAEHPECSNTVQSHVQSQELSNSGKEVGRSRRGRPRCHQEVDGHPAVKKPKKLCKLYKRRRMLAQSDRVLRSCLRSQAEEGIPQADIEGCLSSLHTASEVPQVGPQYENFSESYLIDGKVPNAQVVKFVESHQPDSEVPQAADETMDTVMAFNDVHIVLDARNEVGKKLVRKKDESRKSILRRFYKLHQSSIVQKGDLPADTQVR